MVLGIPAWRYFEDWGFVLVGKRLTTRDSPI